MDEQQMQQMGSLFDERICEILKDIMGALDEADALIQKPNTVDKARIRIAHANAMAESAHILLRPNIVNVEDAAEATPESKKKGPIFRVKKIASDLLPGD